MKKKVLSTLALSILLLNTAVFATGDTKRKRVATPRVANSMIGLLPASDGVMTLDVRKALNDVMPRFLGANQKILGHVNAAITEMQTKTGIDIRKFESVVAGLAFRETATGKVDMAPVVIARGDVDANALIGAAKLAAGGSVREEKVGATVVYVFPVKIAADKNVSTTTTPAAPAAAAANVAEKVDIPDEMAATTLDGNTIVFGTLDRVRQTLEHQTVVSPDITTLLSQDEASVATFALRTPNGMGKLIPIDNDQLGANIDSIRYMAGSMEMTATGASMFVMARTQEATKAKSLYDTLDGLKMIGKAFLGNSKRPEQKVFARLIEGTKLTLRGNDVRLDMTVPQADIDLLVAQIK